MSNSKRYSEGNKGSDLNYRGRVLKGLQNISDNTDALSSLSGLSLEATQQQVLTTLTNLLAENKLDFEMKSVKDANGDVFQLRGTLDEETGVFSWDYIDADGNIATPVAPVEFLNPDGLLADIITELQTLNGVDFATAANQTSLISLITTIDGVLDNSLIQLQAINANTDQLETLSTDIKNLLTTIDADTSNIATDIAAIEILITTTNTLLTTIDAVIDQIQTNTLNTVNELTSANVTLTAVQNELIALNNTAGTLATEATQLLINTTLGSILAQLDVDLSTRASEATLASLLAAFNAEGFAQEVTLADLNSKFNTLGQKASAASAPVVMSTEQEAIFDAIKTAVENIDADLGTGGLALEATQLLVKAVLDSIKLDTANLDVALSTRATEATLALVLAELQAINIDTNGLSQEATQLLVKAVLDTIKTDTGAMVIDLAAIEVLLTTIDAVLDAIKLDTANLDVALSTRASEVTLAALLTAFNNEDFASQTTLAALLAAFNGEDFATETTLNAIKLQTDQMSYDGNSALEVSLPTGIVSSRYTRLAGIGSYTVAAGNTKVSVLNYGSVPVTVDNGFGPEQLDPGIGLDFAAPEGKTLGAITTASTSASALVAITQVAN